MMDEVYKLNGAKCYVEVLKHVCLVVCIKDCWTLQ